MFDTRPVLAKHLARGDSFKYRGDVVVVQSVERPLVGSNVTVTYRKDLEAGLTCYVERIRKNKKIRIYK